MRKSILVAACLLVVMFTGCEDLQRLFGLLPPGKVVLSSGANSGGSGISSASMKIASATQPSFTMNITIEKVEISKDGTNWTTLVNTTQNIDTEGWWQSDGSGGWSIKGGPVLDMTNMELDEGDYYAIRVYFGSNITANCYEMDYSTLVVTANKTRTDFNTVLNPITFFHPQCPNISAGWNANTDPCLEVPITIEDGKETQVMIIISCDRIPMFALCSDSIWNDFKNVIDQQMSEYMSYPLGPDGLIGVRWWFKY